MRGLLLVVEFEAHLVPAVGVVLTFVADLALVTHFNGFIIKIYLLRTAILLKVFFGNINRIGS